MYLVKGFWFFLREKSNQNKKSSNNNRCSHNKFNFGLRETQIYDIIKS